MEDREPASSPARSRRRGGLPPAAFCIGIILSALRADAIAKFSIGPPRSELRLVAGTETTILVDVVNHGDENLRLKVYAADFDLDVEGNPVYPKGPPGPRSCSEWFRFNPQILQLDVGGSDAVRATAVVPKETRDGTYRCALFFEDVPPPPAKGQKKGVFGMDMRARLASIVYADVGPTGEKIVRVEKVEAAPNEGARRVEATAEIVPAGGGYIRAVGTWEAFSAEGKSVAEEPVNQPLLPEHRRRLHWSPELPPGKHTIRLSLDYGGPKRLVAETSVTVPSKAP